MVPVWFQEEEAFYYKGRLLGFAEGVVLVCFRFEIANKRPLDTKDRKSVV